ncbi:PqiC family protein [Acetobacteraceae bacterium ESL0709]|nr:PqiC family protein [Acetobacteraceae bacterium ESL0697]MDF7677255.1 PqiC family protein [Acetobacteraceae bacterium ESL0709]
MMKYTPLLARVLFLGVAMGVVSGCSSVEPRYYSLAPCSGTVIDQSFVRPLGSIKVYNASFPSRLDRDTIVQGDQNYRLKLAEAASWSEPLGEMLSQILVSDLSQRLPGRVIVAQNQPVAMEPSEFVDLAIQNFERDDSRHVIIRGVISVRKKSLPQDMVSSEPFYWISPQPVSDKAEDFVASLSQGVGNMADQLAVKLR